MTIPFNKIITSQPSIQSYLWIALMMSAIFFSMIWVVWFFTSPIEVYAVSPDIYLYNNETIKQEFSEKRLSSWSRIKQYLTKQFRADFSAKDLEKIKPGQRAYLYLNDDKGEQKQIPATVTKISYPVNGKGQVFLEAKSEYTPHAQHPFHHAKTVNVKINIGQLSPATILFRASGLGGDTPKVTSWPRNSTIK
jgi:hypothetical protein